MKVTVNETEENQKVAIVDVPKGTTPKKSGGSVFFGVVWYRKKLDKEKSDRLSFEKNTPFSYVNSISRTCSF